MTISEVDSELIMDSTVWQVQDAKARFSEVVEAATRGKPQRVTRRGKDAVVIVSARVFDQMSRAARSGAPSLAKHLLAIPREKSIEPAPTIRLREVNF